MQNQLHIKDSTHTVGVIGTGSFGLAISKLLSYNSTVLLYGRNETVINQLSQGAHPLSHLLPTLEYSLDLEEVCKRCQVIIPSIPSTNFTDLMKDMTAHLKPSHVIIHTIKGLSPDNSNGLGVKTMSKVIMDESNVLRIGCLSGPNLSKEIMQSQPAAAVIASKYKEVRELGKSLFNSKAFSIELSDDLYGAELSGALKNIVALGTGMIDGLGWGKNTQAYFITKAWHDMMYIASTINGSKPIALMGLAGIGDLIATATSEKSRNFAFGIRRVIEGPIENLDFTYEELAEGVYTTQTIYHYLKRSNIQSTLVTSIYNIIFEKMDVQEQLSSFLKSDSLPLTAVFEL